MQFGSLTLLMIDLTLVYVDSFLLLHPIPRVRYYQSYLSHSVLRTRKCFITFSQLFSQVKIRQHLIKRKYRPQSNGDLIETHTSKTYGNSNIHQQHKRRCVLNTSMPLKEHILMKGSTQYDIHIYDITKVDHPKVKTLGLLYQ